MASEDLLRYNFSTSSAGVVEVETEADSTPSNVLTLLQEQCPQIHPVKTERFALLKLARHKEVNNYQSNEKSLLMLPLFPARSYLQ